MTSVAPQPFTFRALRLLPALCPAQHPRPSGRGLSEQDLQLL